MAPSTCRSICCRAPAASAGSAPGTATAPAAAAAAPSSRVAVPQRRPTSAGASRLSGEGAGVATATIGCQAAAVAAARCRRRGRGAHALSCLISRGLCSAVREGRAQLLPRLLPAAAVNQPCARADCMAARVIPGAASSSALATGGTARAVRAPG